MLCVHCFAFEHSDAVVVTNLEPAAVVVAVNESASKMWPGDSLLGKSLDELFLSRPIDGNSVELEERQT